MSDFDQRDIFDNGKNKFFRVEHTRAMNEKVQEQLVDALACQQTQQVNFPVYLIAQTASGIKEIQEWVYRKIATSGGISVVTYRGLILDLWSIFGDGRTVADGVQVRFACRAAMKAATGKNPSLPAADLAERMLDVVLSCSKDEIASIAKNPTASRGAKIAAEAAIAAERYLNNMGMVHVSRAATIIIDKIALSENLPLIQIVSEDPSENDFSQAKFYDAISAKSNIAIVRRDASVVSFSDMMPVGKMRFALSLGAHAYPETIARSVKGLLDNGADGKDIVIVTSKLAKSTEPVLEALRFHDIAFETRLGYNVFDTALGIWFATVERWRNCWHDMKQGSQPAYDADQIIDFAEVILDSPYCRTWENAPDIDELASIALGTIEEPLDDPFFDLLVAEDRHAILNHVTQVAHPAEENSAWRQDDMEIAKTIGDMLRSYKRIDQHCDIDDLRQLSVQLPRSWGNPNVRCRIISRTDSSYDHRPHVILCDLDDASCSGYTSPSPFACLTDLLEVSASPWQNSRLLRFQVADMLRHVQKGSLTLIRLANDIVGNALPASPIYNELAETVGKLDQMGIPIAAENKLVLSEADMVEEAIRIAEKSAVQKQVQGGGVQDMQPLASFIRKHKDGNVHKFSPTDLELYWTCPRKWFVSRNGAGYDEKYEASFTDARTCGNILHSTFEGYYEQHGREHYRADLDVDLDAEKALRSSFDAAVAAAIPAEISSRAQHYAAERLYNMARALIQRDKNFLPGFTPWLLEDYLEGEIFGLRVGGIVDRVDISQERTDNGKLEAVIVDYKGSPDNEYEWNSKSTPPGPGLHIQGMIYALLFEQKHPDMEVVGIIYRGYSNELDKGMSCVALNDDSEAQMDYQDFRNNLEIFEQMFETMANDLVAGKYPIAPYQKKAAACRFCPVASGCVGKAAM